MKTWYRICIKDFVIHDKIGQKFKLERGKEYLTGDIDKNGDTMVFSKFWVDVPASLFAGEIRNT